jgi:putative FmdB family regulatory protein
MPFYDFRCEACGRTFDENLPVDRRDEGTCPHCGSRDVKRLVSVVNAWSRGGCAPSAGGAGGG